MARRSVRVGAVGVAGGALLAIVTTALTGSAGAAVVQGSPVADTETTFSYSDQSSASEYWTPGRMRDAKPFDRQVNDWESVPQGDLREHQGKPRTVPPRGPKDDDVDLATFPELGARWEGAGEVTMSVGRVFFTYQGSNAACSAAVVTSENKSTVLTAGHCVYLDGAWHENWIFVPGYDSGEAPYGEWPAEELLTTSEWTASEDLNYDVGVATVVQVDGQAIEDVVGAQGIAFNQDRAFDAYSFGYPAQDPYDGEQLIYSSGTTFDDTFGDTTALGIDSDQTGGTSGGPWFRDFDESTGAGVVNSVNSFGYIAQPGVLYGPYFGPEVEALYEEAQAAGF